jgi:hypothetical protein
MSTKRFFTEIIVFFDKKIWKLLLWNDPLLPPLTSIPDGRLGASRTLSAAYEIDPRGAARSRRPARFGANRR